MLASARSAPLIASVRVQERTNAHKTASSLLGKQSPHAATQKLVRVGKWLLVSHWQEKCRCAYRRRHLLPLGAGGAFLRWWCHHGLPHRGSRRVRGSLRF